MLYIKLRERIVENLLPGAKDLEYKMLPPDLEYAWLRIFLWTSSIIRSDELLAKESFLTISPNGSNFKLSSVSIRGEPILPS